MEIPQALREAMAQQLIGSQMAGIQKSQMIADAQAISLRYRTQSGRGKRLLTKKHEAAAYAIARMPATFSAVYAALDAVLSLTGHIPETLLDAGAGTGAASWAADSMLNFKSIVCLERERAMLETGRTMMTHGSQALRDAIWIQHDLVADDLSESAELVVASYVLNEMTEQDRLTALRKLWDATVEMLLIIEPGTPAAFSNLLTVRQTLLQWGANLVAPCPHINDCPKTQNNWCHFTCRVARSRLHREMKGGEAPYEDEKFSYMVFTRKAYPLAGTRVLRHPQIRGGHIMLQVCTAQGAQDIKLTKKDGEKYKVARKAKAGDSID